MLVMAAVVVVELVVGTGRFVVEADGSVRRRGSSVRRSGSDHGGVWSYSALMVVVVVVALIAMRAGELIVHAEYWGQRRGGSGFCRSYC